MPRWEPNAADRLRDAAMAMFDDCGFDAATVAEISERAGLTERTFFRHFADKREVLFSGSEELIDLLVERIVHDDDPASSPYHLVIDALALAAHTFFDPRRSDVHRRQVIVDAHPELRERELIKMELLITEITTALGQRNVAQATATLIATAAIAVFRVAFRRWITDNDESSLAQSITSTAADLNREIASDP